MNSTKEKLPPKPHGISVCICTYKRPQLLERLLGCLLRQSFPGKNEWEIIVVDNDKNESARDVVEKFAGKTGINIRYYCELQQNISLARNRAVREAGHDLIAFIDDDEFPAPDWLKNMVEFFDRHECDGVLGPVKPVYAVPPPDWIIKSKLLERPEHRSGYPIRAKDMRTGNALLKKELFSLDPFPFDPAFGLTGGEDVNFFERMTERGYKFLWCQEAVVYETVPPERLTLEYQLRRALCRGKSRALMTPFLSLSSLKSLLAIILYFLILPASFLAGRHRFNIYLIKLFDHLGKLTAYSGLNPVKTRMPDS